MEQQIITDKILPDSTLKLKCLAINLNSEFSVYYNRKIKFCSIIYFSSADTDAASAPVLPILMWGPIKIYAFLCNLYYYLEHPFNSEHYSVLALICFLFLNTISFVLCGFYNKATKEIVPASICYHKHQLQDNKVTLKASKLRYRSATEGDTFAHALVKCVDVSLHAYVAITVHRPPLTVVKETVHHTSFFVTLLQFFQRDP